MSIIKQISVFDGSSWGIDDIGANAGNIDLIAPSSTVTTNLAGSSNLFTALNNILPTNQLTASKVVITDANKKLATSSVTSTQLGRLSGVSDNVQTQISTLNTDLTNKLDLVAKNAIPQNSNLNNYNTTPGVYYVGTDGIATTISNIPQPASGVLYVLKRGPVESGYLIQFYITTSSMPRVYERLYNNGSWTSWLRTAFYEYHSDTVTTSSAGTASFTNTYNVNEWACISVSVNGAVAGRILEPYKYGDANNGRWGFFAHSSGGSTPIANTSITYIATLLKL